MDSGSSRIPFRKNIKAYAIETGSPRKKKFSGDFRVMRAFMLTLLQAAFSPDILMRGLPEDFPDPPNAERLDFPSVQQTVGGILPDK